MFRPAAAFRRRRPREVRPRTGVKVFEFGKLKLEFVERRVFDFPDRVVELAVELDEQFEFLLGDDVFPTRERIAFGSEHVTPLVRDDVRVVGAWK